MAFYKDMRNQNWLFPPSILEKEAQKPSYGLQKKTCR